MKQGCGIRMLCTECVWVTLDNVIFAFLTCCVPLIGNQLPTFRDNLSVLSSSVNLELQHDYKKCQFTCIEIHYEPFKMDSDFITISLKSDLNIIPHLQINLEIFTI
jgi:hypothetical protein